MISTQMGLRQPPTPRPAFANLYFLATDPITAHQIWMVALPSTNRIRFFFQGKFCGSEEVIESSYWSASSELEISQDAPYLLCCLPVLQTREGKYMKTDYLGYENRIQIALGES
jgi:hypothetical protein